jgi:hypothetical protein
MDSALVSTSARLPRYPSRERTHQCGAEFPDGSTSGCWRAHGRVSGCLRALPARMLTRLEHARRQVAHATLKVAKDEIERPAVALAGRQHGFL